VNPNFIYRTLGKIKQYMKIIIIVFSMLLFISCANSKETNFTASTPAATVIRYFLGIPLEDSIDFIRWKLTLDDDQYKLQCNYGIGKPNTNGFINGGKKISLSGIFKKEKNIFLLQHDDHVLKLAELNTDLIHLLDIDNSLLVGNGGWSYTLNNISPSITDNINITPQQSLLKDSMTFEGRTPCAVPGIIPAGMNCYKLKWHFVFYADNEKKEQGQYKVMGTPWREKPYRTGSWKMARDKNAQITYQLNDEKGNGFIYLLKADENILLFANAAGKLLVGNEDFSYTLNRKW
jgi:hypothetical protein